MAATHRLLPQKNRRAKVDNRTDFLNALPEYLILPSWAALLRNVQHDGHLQFLVFAADAQPYLVAGVVLLQR